MRSLDAAVESKEVDIDGTDQVRLCMFESFMNDDNLFFPFFQNGRTPLIVACLCLPTEKAVCNKSS